MRADCVTGEDFPCSFFLLNPLGASVPDARMAAEIARKPWTLVDLLTAAMQAAAWGATHYYPTTPGREVSALLSADFLDLSDTAHGPGYNGGTGGQKRRSG
jgi:hypothetical protein